MLNEKVYIWDTIISYMGEREIRIRLKEDTLRDLKIQKKLGGFPAYNDLLKYYVKNCPITSPVFREGGE